MGDLGGASAGANWAGIASLGFGVFGLVGAEFFPAGLFIFEGIVLALAVPLVSGVRMPRPAVS